jgi:hypothetical protein
VPNENVGPIIAKGAQIFRKRKEKKKKIEQKDFIASGGSFRPNRSGLSQVKPAKGGLLKCQKPKMVV